MEVFLKLSEIGSTSILTFFQDILIFFNTPMSTLLGAREGWFGIFNVLYNPLMTFFFPNGVSSVLEFFGLDMSLPLWGFLLAHLTTILFCLIIIKILDFVN